MDKVNKILETDITAAIDAHKVYGKAVVKINDRMNYIIRYCVTMTGGKFEWWDWNSEAMAGGKFEWWDWSREDYESHSSGDFMLSYNHDVIQVRGEWTNNDNMAFIDKDGGEWGLEDGFPTRWLYEDFEEEYTNGLKLYKELQ